MITLTVTVILFQLVNATFGSQYKIADVELGGFNGIPAVPAFNLPGASDALGPTGMWYAAMSCVILVYVVLRVVIASRFGRVVLAIRGNEVRAQLVGYDPNPHKLLAFVIVAGIAGLAGCLFAAWGGFISPTVFSLTNSAQVIIFVLVGGLGTDWSTMRLSECRTSTLMTGAGEESPTSQSGLDALVRHGEPRGGARRGAPRPSAPRKLSGREEALLVATACAK